MRGNVDHIILLQGQVGITRWKAFGLTDTDRRNLTVVWDKFASSIPSSNILWDHIREVYSTFHQQKNKTMEQLDIKNNKHPTKNVYLNQQCSRELRLTFYSHLVSTLKSRNLCINPRYYRVLEDLQQSKHSWKVSKTTSESKWSWQQ